jgi:putative addiction module component (TIGR02574 family)
MVMNAILKEFSQLGKYEKFELIEQLWDSIDADENAPPMSDALHAELEKRLLWAQQHPGQGKTIEQIAAGLGVRL